jgi:hypothetical protein
MNPRSGCQLYLPSEFYLSMFWKSAVLESDRFVDVWFRLFLSNSQLQVSVYEALCTYRPVPTAWGMCMGQPIHLVTDCIVPLCGPSKLTVLFSAASGGRRQGIRRQKTASHASWWQRQLERHSAR